MSSVIDTRMPALLRSGNPVLGTFVGIPSPALVEMCGHAGLDFVVIDNEHGPAGIETTEHLIRAARAANVAPIVRTQEADILRVLDVGASGIQVPQVESAAQAARIVAAAKYPPVGTRGAAFSTRAAGYGFFGGDPHIAASNEGTVVVIMVETREGVKNLDAILDVPGVDAVFIGPNDLSFAMGYPGKPGTPEVAATIERCIRRIAEKGVAPGVITLSVADHHKYLAMGARYLPGLLSGLIRDALRATVRDCRAS
jgi:2-keto-3-deoxy-L-rhamnonate aldolase RhmA